ncbi:pyridoxal phosphate-dependent aminotransferase [Edaphobacter albus]|uniref:pyridoxal phosphate-dependent aminotransferase n=1 Tax=Edaphobacter sp. 4G125 TaxID=2763071 RepID=UPI001648A0F7|nr:pyridoxal phosphate-dependent aminotransferase [Edaphobacter sp. 4G125]QNI38162.1 pyridoxal phosphate-dependent aminotransferase [Edaphobacter sp. 4G125]
MSQRFSSRTGWDLAESAFAESIRRVRSQGRDLIDLTVSNPTTCGFDYDAEAILAPLSDPRALLYDPDPRGMLRAREAVTSYYADHKAEADPDSLVLTTSTSEGYGYLFRLLCDAGDEVLVAQPSYPLFDFLADLEDVRLRPYPLFYDYGWWIDFAELERRVTSRTRAIVLVNPNNPTGQGTSLEERQRLEEICLRHQLALIVDEVFLDYPLDTVRLESFARGPHPVLTFVLSGMSKIAGLPQMKVGWIAAFGPEQDRKPALARLEVIADTFLSMNAPAQFALPRWLQGRGAIQQQILLRATANLAVIKASGLEALHTDAGWSTVLRLPRIGVGAEDLLEREGVIVHPGAFYGMAETERIVISLIASADQFTQGVQRIKTLAG